MENQEEKEGVGTFTKVKWAIYAVIALVILFNMFSGDKSSSDSETTYTSETVYDPTQGVITKVEEIQEEVFKITDEEIVPAKEDSRIIANYLNGSIDTFTLDEVALVDTTITDRNDSRFGRSLIRSVVIGGVIGYVMGRPMGRSLNRGSYRNDSAYNRSNTTAKSTMKNSARARTVRKPVARKTGYGSGKSTRSYGG